MELERKYIVTIKDTGMTNVISNKGFLNKLEDIACLHSHLAGYGVNEIPTTHVSWFLLSWKVEIFDRPTYNSEIAIKTWSRIGNKYFTYRDFEIYDEKDKLIGLASSKWALVNVDTGKIKEITEDIINEFHPEEKTAFNEPEIEKLREPHDLPEKPTIEFTVSRRDIDVNKHMHNVYYLDYAYETMPEEIFNNNNYDNFEIMYKKGLQLGQTVKSYFIEENDDTYIVMKEKESNKLNAIIKFYKK